MNTGDFHNKEKSCSTINQAGIGAACFLNILHSFVTTYMMSEKWLQLRLPLLFRTHLQDVKNKLLIAILFKLELFHPEVFIHYKRGDDQSNTTIVIAKHIM